MSNFINKANLKHNFKYDYSKSIYKNAKTKVIISCKEHGDFLQTPDNHLQGQGCQHCRNFNTSKRSRKSKEVFEKEANLVHNFKYDYTKSVYEGSAIKLEIICSIHGSFFQKPSHHVNRKQGCPSCKGASTTARCLRESSTFKLLGAKKHNNYYTYENVVYEGSHSKVNINCPLHGSFFQTPASHLRGNGCSLCARAKTGWTLQAFKNACNKNKNNQGILYIIRCFNNYESFYKIGITSRCVKKRYSGKKAMPYEYEIIQEIYDVSENVWRTEKMLHQLYNDFLYKPKLRFGGEYECFKL